MLSLCRYDVWPGIKEAFSFGWHPLVKIQQRRGFLHEYRVHNLQS